ncbi:hypothetical protein SNE40_021198 [Patella caerulea]|uniref:HTH psq-type domain-containing protein n=1 Tax=Patella caerulea TaxID=87958 RepID=A0AAN8GGK5_PATCE
MVRNYKRKVGSRSYRNYTEDALQNAIQAVQSKRLSVKKAAETYKIPRKTLGNKVNEKHLNKPGRPTVFSKAEEDLFCAALVTVQKWGFPFDLMDFRCMVKSYLDKSGRKCLVFKENYPGLDFCQSFLQRNKTLSNRNANNMKRARATVTPEEMEQYFDNLAETTDGVPLLMVFHHRTFSITMNQICLTIPAERKSLRNEVPSM